MPHSILVIEDEKGIRRFVKQALEAEHYTVFEADSYRRGLLDAGTRRPDLLVLDLGLPDGDGLQLLREFRTWSQVPVLVLSARQEEQDKIDALDAGADDFLCKPFGVGELLARVRACLRRYGAETERAPVICFGEVEVDVVNRRVLRGGCEVHLTQLEYRLLVALLNHPGKVLTQRHLLKEVWGPGHAEQNHYLRIYMRHLRQKLEIDPTRPRHFITETGIGYRFV